VSHFEALDIRQSVHDATAELQEERPRRTTAPTLQRSHRKPPSLCKLVLEEVWLFRRETCLATRTGEPGGTGLEKAGQFTDPAINARMSSTRHAVMRGPSLTGFG
jgi:hypothetical protein